MGRGRPGTPEEAGRRLLRTVDAVLHVAHALMVEDAPLVGDRAVFLDHGVDLHAFGSPGPEPADLAAIARPRLGYLGALSDATADLDLLERLAMEVPMAQLLLVGSSRMNISRLLALPNVHWLGQWIRWLPIAPVSTWRSCHGLTMSGSGHPTRSR